MKRPSFQFYPGDWQSNSNLRRCTHAEKGVWLDVLCLMHDQPEYGVLRWTLKEIAQASGARLQDLKSLVTKGVLKGSDAELTEPFVYTPRSGRKDGEPVTLVPTQPGSIWYSSRMVKDEYVRTIRGESTRFGDGNDEASKPAPKAAPKPPFGDGSSSSSSPSGNEGANAPLSPDEPADAAAKPEKSALPTCPHVELIDLYAKHLPMLPQPRAELWDGARAAALKARWAWTLTAKKRNGQRYATDRASAIAFFDRFFAYVATCPHLVGENDRRWTADMSWLCKADNFAKVLQGNYEAQEAAA